MNSVEATYDKERCEGRPFKLEDFTKNNFSQKKSSFIGKCGNGPRDTLYLICYSCIVKADDTHKLWDLPRCPIYVQRFCNIKIIAEDE